MAPLLPLVLAAAPYFFTADRALYRAEVEPSAAVRGVQPARELSRARVELPGLVLGHSQRDGEAVAVVCPPGLTRTDAAQGCPVYLIDARGGALPLGLAGLSAELAPGNRAVLVWTDDLRLLRVSRDTLSAAPVASSVLEPRLSADGQSFAFARAPGLTRLTPGFVACPFVQRFGAEPRRVDGPCHAQAPFVSPTGAALYVSTAGGLAGLVHAGRRVEARVPGRELLWLDGDRALYSAHYEAEELWLFDARLRQARLLGPGREPALVQGAVLAFDGKRVVQVEVAR